MKIAITDSYCRERAAKYLVEMDEVMADESGINWRFLSTESDALSCDASEFENPT